MIRKFILVIFVVVFFLVIIYNPILFNNNIDDVIINNDTIVNNTLNNNNNNWRDIVLKDVKTGKSFKISDFKGKTILLESFAVWCPTCKEQQDEIKKLHEIVEDDIISISIDTDPNEDELNVLEHVNTHGYTWFYSVFPIEATRNLIDEFGIEIVNAPSSPIVFICEDQSAHLLKRGVKSVDDLLNELDRGCIS